MENEATPPPPTPSSQPQSSRRSTSSFYVDWSPPCIGVLNKDGSRSDQKGDFAIRLETLVQADANTGYLATVKRGVDESERTCFFTIESAGCKSRFMAQINNSFGSGGMSLAFNEMQFGAFVQFLKMHNSVNIRTAATIVGQQSCGQVWVMGKTQIDGEGEVMPPNNSPYIWLDRIALGEAGSIATNELLPTIHTPLSIDVLSRLLNVLEVVMKHNFFSAVLVVAGGVLSLHYSTIVKEHIGCPVVVAFGPSETGKTTALTAALSLSGSSSAIYERGTNAFFLERASLSSLPFGIDDPPQGSKGNDISDLIVDLYQGGKTANLRKGSLLPKSVPLVASNFSIRTEARVATRATVIPFEQPPVCPESEEEEGAFDDLEDLVRNNRLSAAVGWAVQLRKELLVNGDRIRELKRELYGSFRGRSAMNWAILLFFAEKLLQAGNREDLFDGILQHARNIGKLAVEIVSKSAAPMTSNEHIIHQTMDDLLKTTQGKSLAKVLQYMRTGVQVNHEDVLAVVLSEVANYLTFPIPKIVQATVKGGLGYSNVSKDFLTSNAATTVLTRGPNSTRRKCTVFILSKLADSTRGSLLKATQQSTVDSTVEKQTSVEEKEEEHFGDGVSLSDIEAEWENIEEEQTVVTRASEKGDEERCTMMDGKEVQEEAREADEKDKVEEMKEKGETVDAEKTDVEEEKDKTGETVEAEKTDVEEEKDKTGETVEAKKTWEEEKDKTGEMKDKGETVEAEKNDVEEEKEKTLKGKDRKRRRHAPKLPIKRFCTRQNTGPMPNWSKSLSADHPLRS